MTAAGRVTLVRRSMRCRDCGATACPLDDRAGLGGFLSPGAVRLACLAAASWSFAVAAGRLDELAGIRLDDEAIRRHCHRAASGVVAARAEPAPLLADADGEAELLVDGVMAPTRDGWRELKLAVLLARPPGDPAEPEAWATRELPRPSASAAYAELADGDAFSAWWAARAEALGIDPAGPLTALGDGAAWIWNAASGHSPGAAQVLDIYHACEHIASAARGLFGEGTAGAADWLGRGRRALPADGWPGLLDHVGATPSEGRTAAGQAALDEMLGYFAGPTGRPGYYGRLRSGRSIGSGAVEGLARTMGARRKVRGRGWLAGSLDGMAALVATVGTAEWGQIWTRHAA